MRSLADLLCSRWQSRNQIVSAAEIAMPRRWRWRRPIGGKRERWREGGSKERGQREERESIADEDRREC
ncbi:hypothetical protein TIFTF001_028585 [Ficus carica]|uniref:Uncharacterized protein n=1 Tax=Ficus carica TaxID=3494 RepID=A0AA88DQP2_FICCA|nr:hypothetical protein TIFTF001_028585 [Ficus carica]